MRWNRVSNPDVVDRRGAGGGLPGGAVALPGGLGVVGVIIYLAISLLGGGSGSGGALGVPGAFDTGAPAQGAAPIPASQDPERDLKDFSVYVFTDVQKMWEKTFADQGKSYNHAKLVLYRGGVTTGGCGSASSAVGPFYCPGDRRVYLDLSFEREMTDKLQAGGDFAWAYVIAHEMGHHVQEESGTSGEVDQARREHPDQANALSVRLELQADCYAGVWAHAAFKAGELEDGDIDEALTAAAAVGDDRLQKQATGTVNPDSFTHGTSAQRSKWFRTGYTSGDPGACDTFST
jgi:predicted metalloprotease